MVVSLVRLSKWECYVLKCLCFYGCVADVEGRPAGILCSKLLCGEDWLVGMLCFEIEIEILTVVVPVDVRDH